jgi:sarcosine oxidase subunit alpha
MNRGEITFNFEGRRIQAQPGDSIAAALFRAGIRTLSYSVKYKRPRGIHCARGRCVMCHMEVDGVPGVPTCITPVAEGMQVRRENYRPFFAPLLISAVRRVTLPAGFYYRMFTRPAFVRRLFLNSLRKMAGVGRLLTGQTRDPYDTPPEDPTAAGRSNDRRPMPRYDVIVVGAGMSGMSAALAAAENGASVMLVDEYKRAGGHAIGPHVDEEHESARDGLVNDLSSKASIDFFSNTAAQAFYPPDTILVGPGGSVGATAGSKEAQTLAAMHRVRASSIIFATGAYDLVPLFENNDTPGIFGARAIRLLIERDGLTPGSRAVIYGTGSAVEETVHYLLHHDIDVAAVIDAASVPQATTKLSSKIGHLTDSQIERAIGGEWISSVTVTHREGHASRKISVGCDLLCIAFPGQGAYELAYQAGFVFEMRGGPMQETRTLSPTEHSIRNEDGISFFVVGELAGHADWHDKVASGKKAGTQAMQQRETSKRE